MAERIRKRRTGQRGLGSRTSSGSHRSSGTPHRHHKHRRKSGKPASYILSFLAFGICVALLLWLISHSRPGVEEIPWGKLSYGPGELGTRGVRYSSLVNDSEYMFVMSFDELPESKGFGITKPAALSVSEAAVLARDSLSQYLSEADLDKWYLDNIALHHCAGEKWYYTAAFSPDSGEVNSDGSLWQLRIPVLMNGDVVSGTVRQSVRNQEKELRMAAESLGVTTEELIMRRKEAAAERKDNQDVTLISNVDTKMFRFEISGKVLAESEDYDPVQPLPFAFHDAAAAALKVYKLYVPAGQYAKWQIEELSLNRWGRSNKWYYLVAFRLRSSMDSVIAPQLLIPVLLKGEAVQGKPLQIREKF